MADITLKVTVSTKIDSEFQEQVATADVISLLTEWAESYGHEAAIVTGPAASESADLARALENIEKVASRLPPGTLTPAILELRKALGHAKA